MLRTITEKDSKMDRLTKLMHRELRRKDEEALWKLLKCKEGRWFLSRLEDMTKINQTCFTGNSHTFYNEGRRDVGLEILRAIAGLGVEAVKLRQKAEMEYIEEQVKARNIISEYMEGETENG